MKLPSLEDATKAIAAISGLGPAVGAATGLVNIVVGLFDGKPKDQAELQKVVDEAYKRAENALDNLDAALDEREANK